MPWCPKCRNEYKAGYTVCADCGCELVEELPELKTVAYVGTEEEIGSMVSFLEAGGVSGATAEYNAEEDQFELLICDKDRDEVKSALNVYFKQILPQLKDEACEAETDENSEEDLFASDDSEGENECFEKKAYVKPKDRAVEYKSGAATLLLVGIVGAVLLILVDLGVISFQLFGSGKILVNVVMGGLFLVFIILGISSIKSYKKLEAKAKEDDDLEAQINAWFDEYVTKDEIMAQDKADEKDEVLYFDRIAIIKQKISDQFPGTEESFLDYISEKIYGKMFE